CHKRMDFAVAERETPIVSEAERPSGIAQEAVPEFLICNELVDDDLESLLHVRALHNSRSMQSQAAGRLTRAANWHRDVAWNQRFSRSYPKLTRSARYRPICPPSGDLRIRVQDVRDTWSCVTADPVSRVGSPRGPIQARRECAGAEMPRFARAQETDHRRPRRRVRRISNPTRTRAV